MKAEMLLPVLHEIQPLNSRPNTCFESAVQIDCKTALIEGWMNRGSANKKSRQ